MSEERKINGINEFLQMSMTNNMPLSVNEKRQIFDLIIDLQNKLQQKENIIKEVREYIEQLLEYKKEDYYKDVSLDYVERILDILEGDLKYE